MTDKVVLRAQMKKRLDGMTADQRRRWSDAIAHHLFSMPEIRCARAVLCFSGTENEPDTRAWIAHFLALGAQVYLPRVTAPGRMKAVRVRDISALRPGTYGILEPVSGAVAKIDALDLILVPGIAFDESLFRLGHGGGFYDRYLHPSKARTVGIAFEIQRVDHVPAQSHDIQLDCLVTECGIYMQKGIKIR